jgi:predicted neuraminidase
MRPGCLVWMISFALCQSAFADDESSRPNPQAAIVKQEFIYNEAPFEQCHASTIVESNGGLVAAWFGGTREGRNDVGIWVSRNGNVGWSKPVETANGVQNAQLRFPCWNPVLFQPSSGPLLLFYKVGPNPRDWWGELKTSADGGKSWSKATRLPDGFWGPIKNKPIELADGTMLCPSSSEHDGWRVHMEWTPDTGRSWHSSGPLNFGDELGIIQPTILNYGKALQILCRSRQGRIVESWSSDSGRSWSKPAKTNLPNPNSGIDAVSLADGRAVLVYNHTSRGRSPLNLAVSSNGKAWKAAVALETEPGEYSYPAVIQTADGLIHTTYTWKRRKVKHVVIDPKKLVLRGIVDGNWPK